MLMMRGRKNSTVTPPCYSQLEVVPEDSDGIKHDPFSTSSKRKYDVIDEASKNTHSDLAQVMKTATKLNLKTRRPSYAAWRAQYMDKPTLPHVQRDHIPDEENERLTPARKTQINEKLDWIRNELIELRRQDQSLARQFLGIRRDLSRLRLSRCCEEHEDMLEDAEIGMEEFHELSRVLDIPYEGPLSPGPLKNLGVTKMNISLRRFSTC